MWLLFIFFSLPRYQSRESGYIVSRTAGHTLFINESLICLSLKCSMQKLVLHGNHLGSAVSSGFWFSLFTTPSHFSLTLISLNVCHFPPGIELLIGSSVAWVIREHSLACLAENSALEISAWAMTREHREALQGCTCVTEGMVGYQLPVGSY